MPGPGIPGNPRNRQRPPSTGSAFQKWLQRQRQMMQGYGYTVGPGYGYYNPPAAGATPSAPGTGGYYPGQYGYGGGMGSYGALNGYGSWVGGQYIPSSMATYPSLMNLWNPYQRWQYGGVPAVNPGGGSGGGGGNPIVPEYQQNWGQYFQGMSPGWASNYDPLAQQYGLSAANISNLQAGKPAGRMNEYGQAMGMSYGTMRFGGPNPGNRGVSGPASPEQQAAWQAKYPNWAPSGTNPQHPGQQWSGTKSQWGAYGNLFKKRGNQQQAPATPSATTPAWLQPMTMWRPG